MRNRKGFTLAETMITLVVLGFVASLVIPSVMSNSRQQEFRAGYQKALNSLNNAFSEFPGVNGKNYKYSKVGTGEMQCIETDIKQVGTGQYECSKEKSNIISWLTCVIYGYNSLECMNATCDAYSEILKDEEYCIAEKEIMKTEKTEDGEKLCDMIGEDKLDSTDNILNNFLKGYLSITKIASSASELSTPMAGCPASAKYFYTADGMRYCINYSDSGSINATYADKTYGEIWVDVNGEKGPNQKSVSSDRLGDTFPIIIMKNRFIPGHPTNETDSELAQEAFFGKRVEE